MFSYFETGTFFGKLRSLLVFIKMFLDFYMEYFIFKRNEDVLNNFEMGLNLTSLLFFVVIYIYIYNHTFYLFLQGWWRRGCRGPYIHLFHCFSLREMSTSYFWTEISIDDQGKYRVWFKEIWYVCTSGRWWWLFRYR